MNGFYAKASARTLPYFIDIKPQSMGKHFQPIALMIEWIHLQKVRLRRSGGYSIGGCHETPDEVP